MQEWQPPEWWYAQGKRPRTDDEYFENMSRIIFQSGLNWKVIEKKWPTTRKVFADFSVDKVAAFNEADVERIVRDEGVVRNRGKIEAVICNAKEFARIQKEYGSFQRHLDSLDKSHNYTHIVAELTRSFRWLGASSANLFLYTVGEPIKHMW